MEAISEFFLGSLTQSGAHLGRIVRKSSRTFSRTVYFIRKKHIIINTLLTFFSLKKVIHLLETIASSQSKFMIIDSVYFAHQWYVFPEMLSGALLYKARWIGGLLSNFKLVWRELFLDTLRDPKFRHFTSMITSITKSMYRLPQAVFVSNRQYGLYAMKEASSLLIPVISLLNSNTKSNWAMYWLPANDRSPYSLKLFFELFDYIICVLKLRRLTVVKNMLMRDRVKEMLWLKNFTPELNFFPTRSISKVNLMSNSFILNKKLGTKSFLNTKRKRVKNLILKHLKSKSKKFKTLKLIKSKNLRYRKLKDKKVQKGKTPKKLKRFKKLDKFARRRIRWLKSYRRKKLRKSRYNRFKRRRWFLRKKRNKHFKSNKKAYRKKLLKRLSFRIHKKVFRKRISFSKSKNIIKNANILLLNRFLLSINETEDSVENVLTNFGLFRLKNYMLRSSSYLKMTQEEKMAYLDKFNLPKAERERLLSL